MSEKRKHSYWEELDEMFEEMHRRFDRMFEDVFRDFSRPLMDMQQCVLEPLADIRETATDVIVTIDLPFVDKKEDISIELLEGSIEITAKTSKPICFERLGTTQRKIRFNEFRKKVKLPTDVDFEGVTAMFKKGVLAINLPKKVQRTRIKVE